MCHNKTKTTVLQHSSLWELLLIFNEKELKDLITFSKFSLISLNSKARNILKILIKMIINKNDAEVTKSSFAEQLNMTIDELNYWMSNLLRVVERFLRFQEKETGNGEHELKMLVKFRNLGLERNITRQSKKVKRILKNPKHKSYHQNYLNFLFYEQYLIDDNRNSADNPHLVKCLYSLIAFFVENILRIFIAYLNRKTIMSIEDNGLTVGVELVLKCAKQLLDNLPIKLQYWAYKMFVRDDWEAYYNKIETEIRNPDNKLEDYLIKDMSLHLMNRAAMAINKGKLVYAEKYLSTIQNLIERNLILDKNILPHNRYVTIVTASLVANESDWLKKFIEEYAEHLATKNKEAIKRLNWAQIYFVEGNYKAARKELFFIHNNNLNLKYDVYHKLKYHKLFVLSYFEVEPDALFDIQLAKFKKWIKGQTKIPNATKQVYLDFFNYIKKIKDAVDLDEQQQLIKEVLSSDIFITAFDRIWLEKKLKL